MINLYNEQGRMYGLKAKYMTEYEIWKDDIRKKLKGISGIDKMQMCDLSCRFIEVKEIEGYTRKKVIIQTEPDIWMPLYILIPNGIKEGEKRPCIITPHGHGGAGKESVAGVADNSEIAEKIKKYNGDYGLQFVKQGYVVFCSDARGSGERREPMDQKDIFSSSCNALNNAAISIGQSLIGMMTWDLMRLIDFINTLDYCDKDKIACCGFSGGGLQALWLSALDDRVACTIISGYFHGFKDSILKTNFCGCNFVPHLWEYVDIGDMGALIAPRPLLIESGNIDPLNGEHGIEDVYGQVEITKSAYNLFGAEQNLCHHVFEGGHMWNGEKSFYFIEKYMRQA